MRVKDMVVAVALVGLLVGQVEADGGMQYGDTIRTTLQGMYGMDKEEPRPVHRKYAPRFGMSTGHEFPATSLERVFAERGYKVAFYFGELGMATPWIAVLSPGGDFLHHLVITFEYTTDGRVIDMDIETSYGGVDEDGDKPSVRDIFLDYQWHHVGGTADRMDVALAVYATLSFGLSVFFLTASTLSILRKHSDGFAPTRANIS